MKSYGEEQKVITAYLDGHISLGRAAVLLGLSSYELDERFRRLEVPRRIGSDTTEEAQAAVSAYRDAEADLLTALRQCSSGSLVLVKAALETRA